MRECGGHGSEFGESLASCVTDMVSRKSDDLANESIGGEGGWLEGYIGV